MAEKALRVLGVAYKDLDTLPRKIDSEDIENELIFVGLVRNDCPTKRRSKRSNKNLQKCRYKDSDDYTKIDGEVIMNRNNNSLWGIKNLSDVTWTFSARNGELKIVERNSVVPIAQGMEINFGNTTGKVEK